MLSHSKGQAFAPDFLASIVMFSFMLSVFFISWNTIIDSQISDQEDREMYVEGQRTMINLINSQGDPGDWDQDSIETVGFAQRPHVLSSEKIEEFDKLDISEQRSLLKAIGFKIEVNNGEDKIYDLGQEIDGDQVYSFRRDVMLNQTGNLTRVELRYTIWE